MMRPHARVQRRVVEHEAAGVVLVERRVAELGAEFLFLVRTRLRVAVQGDRVLVARQEHAAAFQRVHRIVLAQRGVPRVGVVEEIRRHARQLEIAHCGGGDRNHSAIMPPCNASLAPTSNPGAAEAPGGTLGPARQPVPARSATMRRSPRPGPEFANAVRHDSRTPRALRGAHDPAHRADRALGV